VFLLIHNKVLLIRIPSGLLLACLLNSLYKKEIERRGKTMNEMITRVAEAAGLDAATAEKAIGMVLNFLQQHAPEGAVAQLMAVIPGAQDMLNNAAPSEGGGGLMGMLGGLMGGSTGGVMALGQQLMSEGLSMEQIKALGSELFSHGREQAGEDVMGEITASVPGLNQFV
jgi:hypothetical protein